MIDFKNNYYMQKDVCHHNSTSHWLTYFSILFYFIGIVPTVQSQDIAVKTNLLYGAGTLTPNLGVEWGIGKKETLDLSAGYNPWNLNGSYQNNRKLVHLLIEPELRYWTCQRFNGHFFGIHGLYSRYNIGGYDIPGLFDADYRYQGDAIGGGLSYGYHWALSKHWGMEFNIGLGAVWMTYDKYDCPKCGDKVGKFHNTYLGPTKAGISLIYIIK